MNIRRNLKMKREIREQENMYYHYINVNPKDKYGGDCVVRAIAHACNQSWEQTVRELTELGIKKGYLCNDRKLFPLYLKQKGFTQMKEPRNSDNKKITVREWLSSRDGWLWHSYRIVVSVGTHHISSIVDNKINDIWDCSKNTMHKWWVK